MRFVLAFLFLIPFSSFAQGVGVDYTYQKSTTPDIEGVQMLIDNQRAINADLIASAKKKYNEHIEKILSYIPADAPNAKEIAERHIEKYNEFIGYPNYPYGMFKKEADKYVLLVRFDIKYELNRDYKANATSFDSLKKENR